MKTDAEIRHKGVRVLIHALGTVEAERFIAPINRERFHYTDESGGAGESTPAAI